MELIRLDDPNIQFPEATKKENWIMQTTNIAGEDILVTKYGKEFSVIYYTNNVPINAYSFPDEMSAVMFAGQIKE